jgi:hypothetical protein
MRIGERKSRRRRSSAASAVAAAVRLCGILRGAGRRCLVQVASEVATRSHGRNRSAVKLLLLNAVSSVRCVVFLLFFFFLTYFTGGIFEVLFWTGREREREVLGTFWCCFALRFRSVLEARSFFSLIVKRCGERERERESLLASSVCFFSPSILPMICGVVGFKVCGSVYAAAGLERLCMSYFLVS